MITTVKLQNIQSHVDTTIEFDPGVNCCTGPSNAGKSAVFRGLEWDVKNEYDWGCLQRHDTSESSVDIDGVIRRRSSSKNEYECNGEIYKALRTGVPEEVQDAMRLSAINFQGQHKDVYFLIADPPGQVARELNKVADLQIIDQTLKCARGKVSEARSDQKHIKGEIEDNQKKIDELQWVIEADKDYHEIEKLEISAVLIDIDSLSAQIDTVVQLQGKLDGMPTTTGDLVRLKNAAIAIDVDLSLEEIIRKVTENQVVIPDPGPDLAALRSINLDVDIDSVSKLIKEVQLATDEVSGFPATIDDLSPTIRNIESLENRVMELERAVIEVFTAEDCFDEAVSVLNEQKTAHKEWLKEVGRCPLCNGSL